MKSTKFEVTRNIEAGTEKIERKCSVNFRNAETVEEMLALSDGKLADLLKTFNDGRWAALRTKVSNTLAGTNPVQSAIGKMVKAFQTLNPGMTEEQVRSLVLAMPGISANAGNSTSPLPAEIDDTYNFGAVDSTIATV